MLEDLTSKILMATFEGQIFRNNDKQTQFQSEHALGGKIWAAKFEWQHLSNLFWAAKNMCKN